MVKGHVCKATDCLNRMKCRQYFIGRTVAFVRKAIARLNYCECPLRQKESKVILTLTISVITGRNFSIGKYRAETACTAQLLAIADVLLLRTHVQFAQQQNCKLFIFWKMHGFYFISSTPELGHGFPDQFCCSLNFLEC